MAVREHVEITSKLLAMPYYYRRWFYCVNGDCVTKQVYRDKYKVWNKPADDDPPWDVDDTPRKSDGRRGITRRSKADALMLIDQLRAFIINLPEED